jgi:hypothetical protein
VHVGDAISNRIGMQNSIYRITYPFGSPFTGWIGTDMAELLTNIEPWWIIEGERLRMITTGNALAYAVMKLCGLVRYLEP